MECRTPQRKLVVLSLGAGVQSSTLALRAARGDITPMPDCAIFADTQSEPQRVLSWLWYLQTLLPFPVFIVTKGSLRENLLSTDEGRFVSVPFFTDAGGRVGMTRRHCTREFKIEVLERKIRDLIGLQPGQRGPAETVVEQWMGISWDERQRMRGSDKRYIEFRYPLIEAHWTRGHCLDWWAAQGLPRPPKSACTFCPYHDDAMWLDMKCNDPQSFADAVEVDRAIRLPGARVSRGLNGQLFLHRSLKPLEQVDFNPDDHQAAFAFGIQNECEGMCGL